MTTLELIPFMTDDQWFRAHWSARAVQETAFLSWWLSYYGPPDQYDDYEADPHEYWKRCAFALAGYLASKS